jgi:competence protein ComEC
MMMAILSLIHVIGIDGYVIPMVHFLNVGQGDATLIVSQGKSLLIDTGGQRHFDLASEVLIPYFKRIRIHQLNYVIITHPDFDHDGALPSLQQQWQIRTIIREPFMPFHVGVFRIENYQWDRHLYQDDNDASLMIGIQWHGCQALVMGDASVATEAKLMQQYPNLKANILRIGHHGSNTSTSEALLMHVQPKVAIMSLGGDNRYGHPHPSVLERVSSAGIPIRRTDLEGTIRYQTCKI